MFRDVQLDSGFDFQNNLIESDSFNVLNFMNFYTGSGVGIADFDQDGLQDIFMGANMSSSALYLNKGDFQFDDISTDAGIFTDRWVTGVSIHDINGDDLPDIYLSVSGFSYSGISRKNMLFVHQGVENGIPRFVEMAETYGLAEDSQVSNTIFFDYDNDGDDDVFMILNPTDYNLSNVNAIRKPKLAGEANSTDKLFRNDGDGVYTDVSREAGILSEGYSLGVAILDVNNDNYLDIYVCNDFLSNDILYVNNGEGRFSNEISSTFSHTSFASMGCDVGDVNGDGEEDILTLDMLPEDHYRYNKIISGFNENRHRYILQAGYSEQYSRNNLQLRNGERYSEVGLMSGVAKTDWSWSALFQDFDNDGDQDLHITNGFGRDMGDLDYINYINGINFGTAESIKSKTIKSIHALAPASLSNYFLSNSGEGNFENEGVNWAADVKSCSTGAAYADLDNDGDQDLVVNNVNQKAFLFENRQNNKGLDVRLDGGDQSIIGTLVTVYGEIIQHKRFNPFRGYLSTMETGLHFGMGENPHIDSIITIWPDGLHQKLVPTKSFGRIEIKKQGVIRQKPIGEKVSLKRNTIRYSHKEDEYTDFVSQNLLPFGHARLGPILKVADINSDGLDDVFFGGAFGSKTTIGIQNLDGSFNYEELINSEKYEDSDVLISDLDEDGKMDIYIVSGGSNYRSSSRSYSDRLYTWTRGGIQKKDIIRDLPTECGSKVRLYDFDLDGDRDLVVFSGITPSNYPETTSSIVFENESGSFERSVSSFAKQLESLGIVRDVDIQDFNDNGIEDLLIVGEWMPLTFIYDGGKEIETIPFSSGWWNSINRIDFDNDGDEDLLIGNYGKNHPYNVTSEEPLRLYSVQLAENGINIPVMTYSQGDLEYPIATRDILLSQLPSLKKTFTNYEKYAKATIGELMSGVLSDSSDFKLSRILENMYLENKGEGNWELQACQNALQLAPIRTVQKVGERYIIAGNLSENELFTGPMMSLPPYIMEKGKLSLFSDEFQDVVGEISKVESLNIIGKRHIVFGRCDDEIVMFEDTETQSN